MSVLTDKPPDVQQLQMQAYCYEYQAMMSRMTWFMTMQYLPLAALGALLAVAAQNFNNLLLVAWSAFAVQVAGFIYCFALYEVYDHSLFIERKLKPKVRALSGLDVELFWGWARHQRRSGKAISPIVGDVGPWVLALLALGAAVYIAWSKWPGSEPEDLKKLFTKVFFVLAFLAFIGMSKATGRVVRVRRTLDAFVRQVAPKD